MQSKYQKDSVPLVLVYRIGLHSFVFCSLYIFPSIIFLKLALEKLLTVNLSSVFEMI